MAIDPHSMDRLESMGIQVWRARATKHADAGRQAGQAQLATHSDDAESANKPAAASSPGPSRSRLDRIRLEAGSGRWLLVIDDADRAGHARLIEDIRAVLGTEDCRFGTWSDSPEAGVAVEDWDAHGIGHALVFGGQSAAGFVQAGELAALSASGQARRALWQQLQPLLTAPER